MTGGERMTGGAAAAARREVSSGLRLAAVSR